MTVYNSHMNEYATEYETFMNTFRTQEVSGEEVGLTVVRMAYYFGKYNLRAINALRAYNQVMRDMQSQNDPGTGKPMTSSKAEVLAKATPEAADYEVARAHVQIIEQYINALKALQKGILNEYAHQ